MTPSCGDKDKKQPNYAQNFKGWHRFLTTFHNFDTVYVFRVEESIAELPYACSDLINPSQLPVPEVQVVFNGGQSLLNTVTTGVPLG